MSRRKRKDQSSLELLLDTICNTFGGILFVAILIVVMLRLTSKTSAQIEVPLPTEAEQLELERQYAELQGMLDALTKAMAALEGSPLPKDPLENDLLEEYKNRQETRRQLFEKRLTTLKSVAELQADTNKANREIQESTSKRKELDRKREDLDVALEEAVAKRTQKIDYSQIRESDKQEVGIVLRYGRLYVWHKYGPNGERRGLNTDEFVVLEESSGAIRSTPNPIAGTIVVDTEESRQAIRARLDDFNPRRQVVAAIVWPDSFAEFRQMKEVMLELGLKYRIMPTKDGGKVFDRGGRSGGVQ